MSGPSVRSLLCAQCRFFQPLEKTRERDAAGYGVGQCRRRAPVVLLDGERLAVWPEVYVNFACGEWDGVEKRPEWRG